MPKLNHETGQSLLTRCPHNPLLRRSDWPYAINTVFNAAATKLPSGETLLLCRVEDRSGISHLSAARSPDGISGWKIDQTPTILPVPEDYPEEEWGIEDPRIVFLSEMNKYAIIYTSYSFRGPGVSLALTSDFKNFERFGMVLPVENKDAALLPKKIDGRWAMLHRPVPYSVSGAHIWISYSQDLKHWGDHKLIMSARERPYWDGTKIGLSPPPIETKEGWLVMYHAARTTVSGTNYYVGLALFDLHDPSKCLRRGIGWIFSPEADYERCGDVDNVVFPCGYTIGDDGDTLNIYYGAADTCIALASGRIQELLDWLKGNT